MSKSDVDAMSRRLKGLDKKLREQIVKSALRDWGKEVRRAARSFAYRNAERTKRQLTVKVKSYKRAIWCGVGVKTERRNKSGDAPTNGRNSPFVGWKSHFMEVGWHAWPKGRSGNAERVKQILRNREVEAGRGRVISYKRTLNGKVITQATKERKRTVSEGGSRGGGRGWKKGLRGFKGKFQSQYARHYMFKAAAVGKRIAPRLIVRSINEAIDRTERAA